MGCGVIFPFFKILQAEAIVTSLISVLIGEIGLLLDVSPSLQSKLKETSSGRKFLYTYYFVSSFWGSLDIGSAFSQSKMKALYDFENLLSSWGAFYADPNDFISIANDPTNRNKLINLMNNIQMLYDDNNK